MSRPLRFRNAAEWRAWLESHHSREREAVVLLSKKSVPEGLHFTEALEEALCFGWIDSRASGYDSKRFTLRFSPRRADSVWSESNRRRVGRLTRAGRMRPAGLATIRAAKASGAWDDALRPDPRPRMPSDLRNALKEVPEAWANFRAWGDAYRAACIRWVVDAKRDETRRKRIQRVATGAFRNERPAVPGY